MPATAQTNRQRDRVFFPIIGALFIVTVFIGFAHSYYLAGLFKAPLPNVLIHIHAVVFSSWLILLTVQMGLVTARRVDVHRKLGLVGFGLAVLMVVLGLLAATDSLRRGFSPPHSGLSAETFYVVPVSAMLLFSTLTASAYRARRRPAVHKRLIVVATVAILAAAIQRWPFEFMHHGPVMGISSSMHFWCCSRRTTT